MLYHLFQLLSKHNIPGSGLFNYITFRSAASIILSLFISIVIGKYLIAYLRRLQIGETVRDLGLEGQMQKSGTPTMGGVIILASILVPTLLFADLTNIYVILMLVSTVWMGAIGFLDDYIKVFKKDKKGLAGKFKIVGQVGLGLLVGATLYFSNSVVVKKEINESLVPLVNHSKLSTLTEKDGTIHYMVERKEPVTTIPFVKDHEFNYAWILRPFGEGATKYAWLVFIPMVVIIITAVSNGANLTDGIDGLASGTSAIIGASLGLFAYVSGNIMLANYLNILYIPQLGELTIFIAAFIGACIGFLWYNAYPAQVFMGDTGSLAIGGIIAAIAIVIRKELLIPVLCGVFLVENLSVMMQVSYFKYTKKKYGEGRRIFLMSPLHHHYQKKGIPEPKIVTRFWIAGILLALLTLLTFKIR